MAVLQLQLDVDSAVYPELHAMLSSIAGAGAREERLRQLASTGLLWERLRVQALGHVPLQVPDLAVPRRPEPAAAAVDVPEAGGVPVDAARAAMPPAETDAEISTLLALRLIGPNAPAMFVREMQSAVDELPVLTEVVDPTEFQHLNAAAGEPASAPGASVPSPARAPASLPDAPARPPDTPRSAKSGTRSRLVRMKEKGLFKNE